MYLQVNIIISGHFLFYLITSTYDTLVMGELQTESVWSYNASLLLHIVPFPVKFSCNVCDLVAAISICSFRNQL